MATISERLREVGTRDEAKAVTVRASDCREAADVIDALVAALEDANKWLSGQPARSSCRAQTLNELLSDIDAALDRARGERA